MVMNGDHQNVREQKTCRWGALKESILRECLRAAGAKNRPWLRLVSLLAAQQANTVDRFRFEATGMIETAFAFIANNDVRGDYCEFGVYRGDTFAAAGRAKQRRNLDDMRLHAFDSFKGLPAISEEDAEGVFYEGQFSAARGLFDHNLRRNRIGPTEVTVTEGMFDETLTAELKRTIALKRVAIAWIDCDLYASAVPVLEFLTDVLVDGAVLIFDDWFLFKGKPDQGEQRACSEWLARNPGIALTEYRNFHWAGNSFIVNRRQGEPDALVYRQRASRAAGGSDFVEPHALSDARRG